MMKLIWITALAVLVFALPLSAASWKVGTDGNTTGEVLGAAIDNTEPGDTLLVYPGTYLGLGLTLQKDLVIIGVEGAEKTILDAEGLSHILWLRGTTEKTVIEGFTFTGGMNRYNGAAISLTRQASATIRNNIFTKNQANFGGAIFMDPQSNPIIEHNLFTENISKTWGGAIYSQMGYPQIHYNTFIGNNAEIAGSAVGFHDSYPTLSHNLFADNLGVSTAFVKTPRCKATFDCNAFWNDAGEAIGFGEGVERKGDPSMQTADPLFAERNLYSLTDKSPYGKNGKCASVGWK